MEVNEILEAMRYNRGRFARQAVLAAIEKREEITPHLLQILEQVALKPEAFAEDGGDGYHMDHINAAYLLAQFRERRAYPLLVKAVTYSDDLCDRMWGNFITEDLCRVLASVAHGDLAPVKQLVALPRLTPPCWRRPEVGQAELPAS